MRAVVVIEQYIQGIEQYSRIYFLILESRDTCIFLQVANSLVFFLQAAEAAVVEAFVVAEAVVAEVHSRNLILVHQIA